MPSIRGSLSNLQPLVDVTISRSANDMRRSYRALLDTGATQSCISRAILSDHALEYRTKMLVQVAGGYPARERAYAFSLGLLCDVPDGTRTLYVIPREMTAPALLQEGGFDVLLGMDFLSTGRLVFDRGEFSFDF